MRILATLGTLFGSSPAERLALPPAAISAAVADQSLAPSMAKARRRAIGAAGTRITAGILEDTDHNSELRGEKWYGSPGKLGIAGKMMRDPHVRQSVEDIVGPLTSARWRFKPASKDPRDREAADFAQWAFIERMPWDRVLRRVIRGYASNGFHLEEMTDDFTAIPQKRFPLHPGPGQAIAPLAFHDRPAWSIDQWHQSPTDTSKLASVRQYVQGSDQEHAGFVTIPADRLVRFTYDQEGANFAGLSVLRSAYQPWKLKIAFLTIDAIKHERTGAGTPSLTLSEDADEEDIAAAEQILAEMRVNAKGYIVLPAGYKFAWEGSSSSDGTNLNEAIERCNKDIAFNVSAGFTLLGLTGKTGSYALAGTQQGAYHLAVDGQARFVMSAFNAGQDGWSPVERITRLNYGADVGIPILQARNLPTRDWQSIAKTYFEGVRIGALTADDRTEEQIRESMELEPHETETARPRPTGTTLPTTNPPPAEDDEEQDDETEDKEASPA